LFGFSKGNYRLQFGFGEFLWYVPNRLNNNPSGFPKCAVIPHPETKKSPMAAETAVSLVVGEPLKGCHVDGKRDVFFSGWEAIFFPRNFGDFMLFMWPVFILFILNVGKSWIPGAFGYVFFWPLLIQHHVATAKYVATRIHPLLAQKLNPLLDCENCCALDFTNARKGS